jgi:hypothetical protein
MRSGPIAATAALLSLALILPGCGEEEMAAGGGEKAGPAGSAVKPTPPAGGAGSAGASASSPAGSAAAKRCGRTLGDFLDSMESMTNTLAVGLEYTRYLGTVNRVRATYAEVPADRLGIVCLSQVASPAEQALNLYIDAANQWGDCLAAPSCDSESIEPRLQRGWEEASGLLGEARRKLRRLG